jgi:hypothetical protein
MWLCDTKGPTVPKHGVEHVRGVSNRNAFWMCFADKHTAHRAVCVCTSSVPDCVWRHSSVRLPACNRPTEFWQFTLFTHLNFAVGASSRKLFVNTFHPRACHKSPEGGVEVLLYSFFNLGARWGGWFTPRPGRFTLGERNPVPIVQHNGWASGPVWTGAENFPSCGILSKDGPSRSESLYRLRYSGTQCWLP